MEAIRYNVVNGKGKQVGELALDARVFAVPGQEVLVHDAVRWQRNERRQGTHSTLTKTTIQGGKKKPFKQKGTGRARAGSSISPHWVGGAVSHGPHPRKYGYRMSKRARWQALAGVLSHKVGAGNLFIVDELPVKDGRTKEMVKFLEGIGAAEGGAILVLSQRDNLVWRACRNLEGVLAIEVAGVNVYDLLKHRCLVSTKEGLLALQERLARAPYASRFADDSGEKGK